MACTVSCFVVRGFVADRRDEKESLRGLEKVALCHFVRFLVGNVIVIVYRIAL